MPKGIYERTPAQLEALARGRERRKRNLSDPTRAAKAKVAQDDAAFVSELPPDAAPRTKVDTSPKRGPVGRPPKAAGLAKIRSGLVMMFTAAGMGLSMLDTYDGEVIAHNAETLADVWVQYAEQNARFRKTLEMMLEGTALGNALMTTAMVMLPIVVHHGLAPDSLLNMSETMGVSIPASRDTPPAPLRSVPTRPQAAADGGDVPPAPHVPGNDDIPIQDFDSVTLPGYSGPPDRVA